MAEWEMTNSKNYVWLPKIILIYTKYNVSGNTFKLNLSLIWGVIFFRVKPEIWGFLRGVSGPKMLSFERTSPQNDMLLRNNPEIFRFSTIIPLLLIDSSIFALVKITEPYKAFYFQSREQQKLETFKVRGKNAPV